MFILLGSVPLHRLPTLLDEAGLTAARASKCRRAHAAARIELHHAQPRLCRAEA